MSYQTPSEDTVRRMLKEAFADVPCPRILEDQNACGDYSHEDWQELRRDFYHYDAEVIRYLLPSILEDAINHRTGDGIETEDVEKLVGELDPFWLDNEVVRRVKLKQFENFTQQQAKAVCQWLRLAREWKELQRFSDWVDAAIKYWCHRGS